MTHRQDAQSARIGTRMAVAGAVLVLWPLVVLLSIDSDSSQVPALVVALLGIALLVGGLVVRALRH